MKIGLDNGHCLRGSDTGAGYGGYREEILTRDVAKCLTRELQNRGHQVVGCGCDTANSVRESLNYRSNIANRNNVDLFVSIHFNSGGGYGTEIFTYGGKRNPKAVNVLNQLVSLGFRNRGIKDGKNLAVVRNTKAEAMLVEVCFVDTSDMNRYANYGAEVIAKKIADGLVGVSTNSQKEVKKVVKYDDKTNPTGDNIFAIPNTNGYIEQASDGRLIIHKDRGNYISIGKGYIDLTWDDNKGNRGSKRISE